MADRIDKIIDAAIDYTNIIVSNDTADWRTAREGLAKMLASLKAGASDHPAFQRLRRFIAEQDLLHSDGETRH